MVDYGGDHGLQPHGNRLHHIFLNLLPNGQSGRCVVVVECAESKISNEDIKFLAAYLTSFLCLFVTLDLADCLF